MAKKQQFLQVNSDYSGIDTNGFIVRKGTYPLGAPELYGASDGLVEHGAAEWVDAPEAVVEQSEDESVLEQKSNAELRALLDANGIDHSKAKNKDALLALFEAGE